MLNFIISILFSIVNPIILGNYIYVEVGHALWYLVICVFLFLDFIIACAIIIALISLLPIVIQLCIFDPIRIIIMITCYMILLIEFCVSNSIGIPTTPPLILNYWLSWFTFYWMMDKLIQFGHWVIDKLIIFGHWIINKFITQSEINIEIPIDQDKNLSEVSINITDPARID